MTPSIILRTEENREAAIRRIKACRLDKENPLGVYIGPYKKLRTLEQNARYWARVGLVVAATGHNKFVLHHYFKKRAFGVRVEQVGDDLVEYVPESRKASRGDFSELMEVVEEFIAEHNIEEAA